MAIQQSKQRARVVLKRNGKVISDAEDASSYLASYGAYLRVPVPKKVGATDKYVVEVTYIGEHQFATPYAKRLAAQQRNEEARKKREKEQEEKALVLRRNRIWNQIELAFEKKGKDAVKFVTCDECDDVATHLGLSHENPGSQVVTPEQITGAVCEVHHNPYYKPFGTQAFVECGILEFFYDGLKQIYINKPGQ